MKPLDEIDLFKHENLIRIIVYLAHIFLKLRIHVQFNIL